MACSADGTKYCEDVGDDKVKLSANGTVNACPVRLDDYDRNVMLLAFVLSLVFAITSFAAHRLHTMPEAEAEDKTAGVKGVVTSMLGIGDIASDVKTLLILQQHRNLSLQFYVGYASLARTAARPRTRSRRRSRCPRGGSCPRDKLQA